MDYNKLSNSEIIGILKSKMGNGEVITRSELDA